MAKPKRSAKKETHPLVSLLVFPVAYLGYQLMAEGHVLWALVAWAVAPIGLFIAFWEALPSFAISFPRVALGLYVTVVSAIIGTAAIYSLHRPRIATDAPEIVGVVEHGVVATHDHQTDLFLLMSVLNRGTPSFVGSYHLWVNSPDGASIVRERFPYPIQPLAPADDSEIARTRRALFITPANALEEKTVEPVTTKLVQGWLAFSLGAIDPNRLRQSGTIIEVHYQDLLGREYQVPSAGSNLLSPDETNLQVGSCPGLAR